MHKHGIQNDDTDEPICRVAMEMKTQRQICEHSGEGEGGTNEESSMDTHTLPSVRQMAIAICSNQCPVTIYRGGIGSEVGGRGYMYTYADSCCGMAETTGFCKAIILQLK